MAFTICHNAQKKYKKTQEDFLEIRSVYNKLIVFRNLGNLWKCI